METKDNFPFFIPWIGDYYKSGLYKGIKVLVIGASHYCTHSKECCFEIIPKLCKHSSGTECTLGCDHFYECTGGKSSKYNAECNFIKEDCHTDLYYKKCHECDATYEFNTTIEHTLRSTTIDEVCSYLCGKDHKSYRIFTSSIQEFLKIKNDKDYIWNHIAFANYAQNFQSSSTGNKFMDGDYEAFLENIEALNPGIVIVWGAVGEDLKRKKFKINTDSDGYIWKWEERKITFLHSYHPSCSKYKDNGKLQKALEKAFGTEERIDKQSSNC